jgi:hypothetical protein
VQVIPQGVLAWFTGHFDPEVRATMLSQYLAEKKLD